MRGEMTPRRLPLLRLTDETDSAPELPDRYRVREQDGSVLVCLEAPTLLVRLERGLSVSASAARAAEPGTIFLDGAAQAGPFVSGDSAVLNLDHHEGCVRPFTLSTCEQAFVLVCKGFDLQSRAFTVYANEPDLDTVLAIWVLLNHRRIRKRSPALMNKLVPMLRLEGAIDVHGFDLRFFCGFSSEVESQAFTNLEHIRQKEADLKQKGEWAEVELARYAAERLRAIDRLLYTADDFEGTEQIEELARAELPEKRLVVACQSEAGIYRVEEQLGQIYERRLGLVVLRKAANAYTLRQVNAYSTGELERVYERLNLQDPAAGNSGSGERWGGASDIGGSPRGRGTRLSVEQIVEACRTALTAPLRRHWAGNYLLALAAAGAVYALAALPFLAVSSAGEGAGQGRALGFSAGLLLLGSLTMAGAFWRGPGFLGLRWPVLDRSWLWAVPLAALAGALGGGFVLEAPGRGLVALAALAAGTELLFRGVVYGAILGLVAGHRRSRLTSPTVLSASIYALWTAVPLLPRSGPLELGDLPFVGPPLALGVALVFGLSQGFLREKSENLLVPVLVHAALAVALAQFL